VLAEVRPHPDSSHLLAVVWAPEGSNLGEIEDLLRKANGHLRAALGRALSRKRVPMLSVIVLPEGGDYAD
jgi:ribosome-binding factor A